MSNSESVSMPKDPFEAYELGARHAYESEQQAIDYKLLQILTKFYCSIPNTCEDYHDKMREYIANQIILIIKKPVKLEGIKNA